MPIVTKSILGGLYYYAKFGGIGDVVLKICEL